ncbi:MAG: Uma2 family endonuclease [Gemmatimonadaceae bacterium]
MRVQIGAALSANRRGKTQPDRGTGVGRAVFSPSDVRREDRRRNRVQPDVFVVRVVDGKRPAYPFDQSDLLLVVEVESPSTARYDYQKKRMLYLNAGVREYWIVSPKARTVSRWRRAEDPGEVLTQEIRWHPLGATNPLIIDVPASFAEALGGP